ncbi:MAG: class II aldolase/adducin family protein [Rickettsiaceae bacterium]|nr:class II aldolase/adducin family protein [Rickettsiaceae bacterium]
MVIELIEPKQKQLELNDKIKVTKIQLAAICHLIDHFGWSDMILNHVSAKIPEGHTDTFLMNPYGLLYDEITASSLVEVDFAGNQVDKSSLPVNKPGSILHSTIYQARSDINAVIHTHTPYGVALSMLEEGLILNDQMSMIFHNKIGYHDFEGIITSPAEKSRIAENLADNKCLILRNHGLVATGKSIAEAFWNYYYLEFACKTQILALSTGKKINAVTTAIKDTTFKQHERFGSKEAPTTSNNLSGNFEAMLTSLMRMLDRKKVKYKE